jgi:molybdenum cofactor biosynthesis protein MoaC
MSGYRMIDVGAKAVTQRRAVAVGTIALRGAYAATRDRTLPKGDALLLAEVAGILAAKNAHATIPLCHPLGLDHVAVHTHCNDRARHVTVLCAAATSARTGVEMEALAGVSGALLAIYDLAKNVESALAIREVYLLVKEGGKHGRWVHPDANPEPWMEACLEESVSR